MVKHNFNAGPSVLPDVVIKKAAEAVLDFNGSGLSILSISHRTKDFDAVMDEAKALFRELLEIPDNYQIFFVGGGASTQFFQIPYNFLGTKAAYVNTGVWTKKAIKEAKLFGEVEVIASGEESNFSAIPKGYTIPTDCDYLYTCMNNTIYGTENHIDIDSPIPHICDMSSDILSCPIDVSKYAVIYGGAQKNLAPSGMAFVIVKNDALGKVEREIPTILNYQTHIDNGSMFNTPPTFTLYSAMESLRWLKANGGVKEMAVRAEQRAEKLYGEIDRNKLFVGTAVEEDRSYMNICWVMAEEYKELEEDFMKFAQAQGMVGIKGHRSVGGFRASCYNALPMESVDALIACMKEYEAKH